MAYRSWLKDVKSIHDLGEHCQNLTFRKPEDEKRDIKYEDKWLARLGRDIPVAEEFKFAYGCRMHDSWVAWIKRSPVELRLRLCHDVAHYFVSQIYEMLDIAAPPPETWIAPVDLVLDDPVYVNAVREDRNGGLRWAQWEDLGRSEKPGECDQLLYDWFFEQDGRIQWVAALWSPRIDSFSKMLYLLVDCARARADDRRVQAIRELVGPAAVDLWTDIDNGVDLEGGWKGWSTMYAYLEHRMGARGIGPEDFRPAVD